MESGCTRSTIASQARCPRLNWSRNSDHWSIGISRTLMRHSLAVDVPKVLLLTAHFDRGSRRRTTSTEHEACATMACATLPSNHRVSPVRPWEPTTIRSARHSSDSSTIAERGSPSRTVVSVDSPASRSAFAARPVISSALEACCCLTSSSVAPASTNSVAGGVYGCITATIRTVEFAGHGRRAISSTAACECGEPSMASRILICHLPALESCELLTHFSPVHSCCQCRLCSRSMRCMPPRARATGAGTRLTSGAAQDHRGVYCRATAPGWPPQTQRRR